MIQSNKRPIALVTGGNRGIGFEVCRQLGLFGMDVVLAARDAKKAEEAAYQLSRDGITAVGVAIDVASPQSPKLALLEVEKRFGRLDVLVNNAGIGFDAEDRAPTTDLSTVMASLETNLFGTWRVTQAFLPLLLKTAPGARIVNVSSEAGSFTSGGYFSIPKQTGVAGYAVSKAALNAMTVKLASALADKGILVNAVCPGWTATYPGALEQGARPVKDGAASVVWAATLGVDGPTGGFFRDGKPLPW